MKNNLNVMEQLLTVDENTVFVAAAATLTKGQRIVRCTLSTANYAVTLPNVSAMAGEIVTIMLDTSAYGYSLTVQDNNEARGWKDLVFTGAGQYAILYSNGHYWRVLGTNLPIQYASPGMIETFSGQVQSSGLIGTAATGATGNTNVMRTADGNVFEYHIKGTQTILSPSFNGTGLNVGMDQTDDDGVELAAGGITSASRCAFIVGTGAFFARLKFSIATVAGTDDCAFGFRKAEAFQAAIDNYDEMAALNVISGDIKIETILNNNATVTTDTTDDWADAETHELEVRVDRAGAVTYLIDGAAPTATAAFSFDAAEVVVPFFYMLQANAAQTGVVALLDFECGYM